MNGIGASSKGRPACFCLSFFFSFEEVLCILTFSLRLMLHMRR